MSDSSSVSPAWSIEVKTTYFSQEEQCGLYSLCQRICSAAKEFFKQLLSWVFYSHAFYTVPREQIPSDQNALSLFQTESLQWEESECSFSSSSRDSEIAMEDCSVGSDREYELEMDEKSLSSANEWSSEECD